MKLKKLIATAALALGLGGMAAASSPAAEAAPSTGISCSTSYSISGRTITGRITSNKTIYRGQTSFKFTYVGSDYRFRTLTYDEGYGRTLSVSRPVGSRSWYSVQSWHAGTKCRTAYAKGAV